MRHDYQCIPAKAFLQDNQAPDGRERTEREGFAKCAKSRGRSGEKEAQRKDSARSARRTAFPERATILDERLTGSG